MADAGEPLTIIEHLERAIKEEKQARGFDALSTKEKIRYRVQYELKLLSEVAALMEREMPGLYDDEKFELGDYLICLMEALYPKQTEALANYTHAVWLRAGVCPLRVEELTLEKATEVHTLLTAKLLNSPEVDAVVKMTPQQFYEYLVAEHTGAFNH